MTTLLGVKRRRIDRRISVEYRLDEPIRFDQGRHVSRYGTAGYWLPMLIEKVEIDANLYDGDEHPRFSVAARGPSVTKAGKHGADVRRTFYRQDNDMPPEIQAMLDEAIALTQTEYAWPE